MLRSLLHFSSFHMKFFTPVPAAGFFFASWPSEPGADETVRRCALTEAVTQVTGMDRAGGVGLVGLEPTTKGL